MIDDCLHYGILCAPRIVLFRVSIHLFRVLLSYNWREIQRCRSICRYSATTARTGSTTSVFWGVRRRPMTSSSTVAARRRRKRRSDEHSAGCFSVLAAHRDVHKSRNPTTWNRVAPWGWVPLMPAHSMSIAGRRWSHLRTRFTWISLYDEIQPPLHMRSLIRLLIPRRSIPELRVFHSLI